MALAGRYVYVKNLASELAVMSVGRPLQKLHLNLAGTLSNST